MQDHVREGTLVKSHGKMSGRQSDYVVKKYGLHEVAPLCPSNSEQRLIKNQRTCGGKLQ